MRKLTFVLVLVVLLVVSTAVVYAGFEWDEDSPAIGEGLYLHWTVLADDPPAGWEPNWDWAGGVETDEGRMEAEAKVWVDNYDEDDFSCTLVVRMTDGKSEADSPLLATASGSCEEVEIEWESD